MDETASWKNDNAEDKADELIIRTGKGSPGKLQEKEVADNLCVSFLQRDCLANATRSEVSARRQTTPNHLRFRKRIAFYEASMGKTEFREILPENTFRDIQFIN